MLLLFIVIFSHRVFINSDFVNGNAQINNNASPVNFVIWHGLLDGCCNQSSRVFIEYNLKKYIDNANVYSIGENRNSVIDIMATVFGDMNEQVRVACSYLQNIESIRKHGYHAIGLSQGSQFHRGLLQRCTNLTVHSLVTIGGQHHGVYGIPHCSYKFSFCRLLRDIVDKFTNTKCLQSFLIQAQYWHSPKRNHTLYKKASSYLADINQEICVNKQYRERMASLKKFVMITFEDDQLVDPVISGAFGYYLNETTVVSMEYLQTWESLSLKQLNSTGRLFCEIAKLKRSRKFGQRIVEQLNLKNEKTIFKTTWK
ncbi:hypothetical protein GJ496_002221 [Pomphorhynchus laevis]|nr:hypothetical protein GJ496_002221 [Pomphorhynchus laevis]